MRPDDREQCAAFSCGPEPYQEAVALYLQNDVWPPRHGERVIVGVLEDGRILGFAAWHQKQVYLPGQNEPQHIVSIPRFGVDEAFHGAKTAGGHLCAGVLYASVELDAVTTFDPAAPVMVEVFCDVRNDRAGRFWRARGFRSIEVVGANNRYDRFIRRAR